jgi:hypothetical protein
MLVWHSGGLIGNGGFEYLFEGEFDGDPEFGITAEAHKTAGLPRSYEAFQDAFALFPRGIVPHDSDERIRQYRRADETIRQEINRRYWTDDWEKTARTKTGEVHPRKRFTAW